MNDAENKLRNAESYFGYENISFFSEPLKTDVMGSYWMLGNFSHQIGVAIDFQWLGFINTESFEYGGIVIGSKPYRIFGDEYAQFVADEQTSLLLAEIEEKARLISKADLNTISGAEGQEILPVERVISIAPYAARLSFNYGYPGSMDEFNFARDGDTYHKIIAENGATVFAVVEMAKAYAFQKDNFFNQ